MPVAVLLAVLAAAPSPIETARVLEPIGWSPDGKHLALRVFYGTSLGEDEPCPGYRDAKGQQFSGGLALVVVGPKGPEQSFTIQVPQVDGSCTKPEAARAALDAAKKQLTELGIDSSAPGRVVPATVSVGKKVVKNAEKTPEGELESTVTTWTETWRFQDGATEPLKLVVNLKSSEREGVGELRVSGRWSVKLAGGVSREGKLQLKPVEFSRSMAGEYHLKFVLFLAPGGDELVAFAVNTQSNMRGGWATSAFLPMAP